MLNALESVTPKKWEELPDLGNFDRIDIVTVMKKPFSILGKCKVYGSKKNYDMFVKIYRKRNKLRTDLAKDVLNEFQNMEKWNSVFKKTEGYDSIRPFLCIPEKYLIVSDFITGDALSSFIKDGTKFYSRKDKISALNKLYVKTGQMIRYKNDQLVDTDNLFDVDELISYIENKSKRAKDSYSLLNLKLYRQIHGYLENQIKNIREDELKLTINHRDLNPGNLMISDKKLYMVDSGKFSIDSFWLDISKLYSRTLMYGYKPHIRMDAIKSIQKSLLIGFGVPEAVQLAIFRLFLLRNSLTHLLNMYKAMQQESYIKKQYTKFVIKKELSNLNRLMTL